MTNPGRTKGQGKGKGSISLHDYAMAMPLLPEEIYSRIQDLSDLLNAMPALSEKYWKSINEIVFIQYHERTWKYIPIPKKTTLKKEWKRLHINLYFNFK